MRMPSDAPHVARVRNGIASVDMADWRTWYGQQNTDFMVRFALHALFEGYVVGPIRRLIDTLLRRKRSVRTAVTMLLQRGYAVAVWTPPGEWRVARTLADLEQIIADGGEVEPPKDAD